MISWCYSDFLNRDLKILWSILFYIFYKSRGEPKYEVTGKADAPHLPVSFRKGNPMNTLINTVVPDFKVQAYHNKEFKTVTRADLDGKWSVFFFYPADFTFVCPTELGELADKYKAFQELGVEIYSVSTDTHFTHKAWHDTSETIKKIQYPMLADPTGHLARSFGVYIEEEGLAYRGTFLVDPSGKIKISEVQDNAVGRNVEELYRKVQAAQFVAKNDGQVCPASWKPGAATLKPGLNLVGKI
jgi:NADH-dependent peroxiredoxin subunit C